MKILDTIKKLISKESDGKALGAPKYFPNPANPAESISSADISEKTQDRWERAFANTTPTKYTVPYHVIQIDAKFNGKHFLVLRANSLKTSAELLTEKGNKENLEPSELSEEEKEFLIKELLAKEKSPAVKFALEALDRSIELSNKEEAYFDTLRSKYSAQPIKTNEQPCKLDKSNHFDLKPLGGITSMTTTKFEDTDYAKNFPKEKIVEQLGVEFIELNKQYESFFYTYIAAISKIRIVRVKNKIEDYLSIVDLTNLEIYFLMDELRKKEQTIQAKYVLSELSRELMTRTEVKDGDTIKINKTFKGITYKQIVLFVNRLEVEVVTECDFYFHSLEHLESDEKEFLIDTLNKKNHSQKVIHALRLLLSFSNTPEDCSQEQNEEKVYYKHNIKEQLRAINERDLEHSNVDGTNDSTNETVDSDYCLFNNETKEQNNLAFNEQFNTIEEQETQVVNEQLVTNTQKLLAINEQETVKETVSLSKKESNYLDFKFEAYCEFRARTLEKETMTLLELAEALSILYGNSVSDWDLSSLSDLYSSTVESINSYEPTDVLIWKDYKVISPSVKPMTVGEAITLLEFDRVAKKKLNNDYNANIDFNLGLEQLAVIMRKEGEQLPIDPAERTLFIDQRKKEVSSAPLWLVLNIRFFFIKKYQPFLISQSINTYLTTKSPAKTNSKKPRSPKRKQKGTAGI